MENKFEGIFVIDINKKEEEIQETMYKINNILKYEGGKITNKEDLGTKKLAYEIKGHKIGRFYFVNFNTINDINTYENKIKIALNTMDAIIKFIIIKV